jgi:hypothetical protein
VSCPNCTTAAQEGASWGGFTMHCRGCCARSIARSPEFHEARTTGTQTRKYRAVLQQVGSLVTPPITHDEVRQAHAADAQEKEAF